MTYQSWGDREVSTVGPLACFPASSSTSHFRPPHWVEDAFVFFIHSSIFQLPLLNPEDPSRLIPTYVLGSLCLHFCCVTVCLYDKHLHTLTKGTDYINTKQKTQDRTSVLMAPLTLSTFFLLSLGSLVTAPVQNTGKLLCLGCMMSQAYECEAFVIWIIISNDYHEDD